MNLKEKEIYIDTDKLTPTEFCEIIIDDKVAFNEFMDFDATNSDIDEEHKILTQSINSRFNTKNGVNVSEIVAFMSKVNLNVEVKEEAERYVIEVIR